MNLEGRLCLSLTLSEGRISAARVRSERPTFASRLLAGRPASVALATIALLFSLCGRAQTIALASAIEQAQGREVCLELRCQRQALVLAEMAKEHLWRLLIDLPQHAGGLPANGVLADLRKLFERVRVAAGGAEQWWNDPLRNASSQTWRQLADALERFIASSLLGENTETWLKREAVVEVLSWLAAKPTPWTEPLARVFAQDCGGSCLPRVTLREAGAMRDTLAQSPAFAKQPHWVGRAAETGALARLAETPLLSEWAAQRGQGVALRLLARLMEVAALPGRLRNLAAGGEEGGLSASWPTATGALAGVETARGLLLHHVHMEQEQLSELVIVAPTEWNFHPAGAWVSNLVGLPVADREEARRRGALLAFALDPCVAWELELADA